MKIGAEAPIFLIKTWVIFDSELAIIRKKNDFVGDKICSVLVILV